MMAATASCKRCKKDFTHLPARSLKCSRFKLAANEHCVIYLKERQISVTAQKQDVREKDEVEGKKKDQSIDYEN